VTNTEDYQKVTADRAVEILAYEWINGGGDALVLIQAMVEFIQGVEAAMGDANE
jgi:hypothetical protein